MISSRFLSLEFLGMNVTFAYPTNDELPLATARAKLVRARQLIYELHLEFEQYKQQEPVSARFVMNGPQPEIKLSWKGLSLKVGIIVGDAVHNLRSALDQAASELARKYSGNDNGVYFPFSTSVEMLPDAVKSKKFDKCGKEAESILYKLEPYRGGINGLRSLHDLNIQDKHKALLPHQKSLDIQFSGSYDITDPENTGSVSVVVPNIHHTFPEGSILGGSDIEQTLIGFADLLDSILDAFEPLLRN
jgi:hypothetical protein